MTAENRIIAKLSDIALVRFECGKCHSVFSWPPSNWQCIPYACQNCGDLWIISGSTDEIFIHNLKDAIQILAKAETGFPFELALEFNRSSDSESSMSPAKP